MLYFHSFPLEIGVAHTVTYIQAALTCQANFNCVDNCEFGYKTGENGCPTCRCLTPMTAGLSPFLQ